MSAAHEFIAAIQAAGLTPPESLIPDGKLHRFASNGKAATTPAGTSSTTTASRPALSATGGALRPGPGGRTSAAA